MGDSTSLSCGPLTIKYLVFFFNLVFFACGLALIVVGVIAQGFFRENIQFFENEFKNPALGIIILGTAILVVSFFGCCGARMENLCMLRMFGFFLGLLLLCEIGGAIAIAVLRGDIDSMIDKNMNETMHQYGNDSLVTSTWDNMQESISCCGTANYTDWNDTPFSQANSSVPDSCCISEQLYCGAHAFTNPKVLEGIFHKGCSQGLKDAALKNLGAIVGTTVALALVQLLGLWMSCSLINAVKKNYESL